jgi:hypothetical protein
LKLAIQLQADFAVGSNARRIATTGDAGAVDAALSRRTTHSRTAHLARIAAAGVTATRLVGLAAIQLSAACHPAGTTPPLTLAASLLELAADDVAVHVLRRAALLAVLAALLACAALVRRFATRLICGLIARPTAIALQGLTTAFAASHTGQVSAATCDRA